MKRLKSMTLPWLRFFGLFCALNLNLSHAAQHSPQAHLAFERIHHWVQASIEKEHSGYQGCKTRLQSTRRIFAQSLQSFELNYDYLIHHLASTLPTSKQRWLEAETDPQVTDEQIALSDTRIEELQTILFHDALSPTFEELVLDFQRFLQIDLKTKHELHKNCLSSSGIFLTLGAFGAANMCCMGIPGLALGSYLACSGIVCELYASPQELFPPALPSLQEGQKTEPSSLLSCPGRSIPMCLPAPSEIHARSLEAKQLESKIQTLSVPRVLETEFLMLVLATHYHRTSFGIAPDPRPTSDTSLTGASQSISLLSEPLTAEELPGDHTAPTRRLGEEICPICLEGDTIALGHLRMTYCQHRFHANCLRKWLNEKTTCPICRKAIH